MTGLASTIADQAARAAARTPRERPLLVTEKDEQRFWARVNRSEFGPAACWPWTGARGPVGYGKFCVSEGGTRRRHIRAHQFAFVTSGRSIRAGQVIRHFICGNGSCCNPAHLAPGTQAENRLDTIAMDRHIFGERSVRAKLTEAQVAEIRRRWSTGEQVRAMAADFSVSYGHIHRICTGKVWRHSVATPPSPTPRKEF